ncbi:hypothetical protein GLV94_01935 [Virgibacillus halodenitrificans]|uniref:hypothetical protein n=1 Tax=Virgibacillus halodenitrificans TaxID=1482 RepID=UPI001371C8B3|nr:hypothetical protein [Virgibacillus halodenitrificans]MYL44394.1 hypothetical protein [Virgibacillus halodenitrificans]
MEKVVMYMHLESGKVVSKVCDGCGEIKLVEDFPTGKKVHPSHCKDCDPKANAPTAEEAPKANALKEVAN